MWCDVQLTLRDDPCDNNSVTRCYIFIRHASITGEIRGRIRSTVGKAKSISGGRVEKSLTAECGFTCVERGRPHLRVATPLALHFRCPFLSLAFR